MTWPALLLAIALYPAVGMGLAFITGKRFRKLRRQERRARNPWADR